MVVGLLPSYRGSHPNRGAAILYLIKDFCYTRFRYNGLFIVLDFVFSGQFLQSEGLRPRDFNSYGSRSGNDQVMIRGTFAHPKMDNKMTRVKVSDGSAVQFCPSLISSLMSATNFCFVFPEELLATIIKS